PTRIWISSCRPPMMHGLNWTGKKLSSNHCFAWFIWERGVAPEPVIGSIGRRPDRWARPRSNGPRSHGSQSPAATRSRRGCDNCYAEIIAERFRGRPEFPNGFDLTLKHNKLEDPLHLRKPRMIFVNSMSDLFHKDIPV